MKNPCIITYKGKDYPTEEFSAMLHDGLLKEFIDQGIIDDSSFGKSAVESTRERLAPNGKPSNLDENQYEKVRTREFKEWFGDWENDPANASKVVDENGEPLVVYHGGTLNPEDRGKDTYTGKYGLYFTSSSSRAQSYIKAKKDKQYEARSSVFPVYLNIRNPLPKKIWSKFKYGVDKITDKELAEIKNNSSDGLIDKGFMGIKYTSQYVVLEPTQVKSAADKLLDALEKAKINTKGTLNAFGLLPATWNAALDIIIAAVKAEKAISEAIKEAIAYIDSTKPDNFDRAGFEGKINELFNNTAPKQEAPKSEPKPEPKPKKEKSETKKTKTLKLGKTALESETVRDEVKEGLIAEGVDYIPVNLKMNQEEASAYVDAFVSAGEADTAYSNVMDMSNGMAGVTRGHIALELFKHYTSEARNATSVAAKQAADLKAAKLAKLAAENFKTAGQEINAAKAWNKLIRNTPEGAIAELSNQYAEQNEPILEKDRKDIQAAKKELEEFLKSEEGQEILREEVDKEIDKRSESILGKEGRKKVVDFFDSLLINTNGKLFDATFALPVAIYNAAIKAMKNAVLLGADAATAVKAGIDYVKANHTGQWKEKEFELTMTEGLKNVVPRKKVAPSKKTVNNILDKWAKRLDKLTPEARKKLLAKSIEELNAVGALSDARFEQFYAEALGLPTLTDEAKQNIYDLVNTINDADAAFDEYSKVNNDPNSTEKQVAEAKEKYLQANKKARKANEAVSDYFRKEKNIWDTLTTIMQGNLLAPFSLVQNVWSNFAFNPLRFLSGGVATLTDYIVSQAAKHQMIGKYISDKRTTNILTRTKKSFKGYPIAFKEGFDELMNGLTSKEINERDLSNKLQPLKSAADLWAAYFKGNKMSANAQLNAWAEMLFGIPAETMFRLLNLGDKLQRVPAEVGKAYEIAKSKGLEGRALEEFLLRPDEESAKEIQEAGDNATFQGENNASKAVNYIQNMIKKIPIVGGMASFLMRTVVPYVKTPTNIIGKTINYALPPLTLARSIYYAKEGDRKKSMEYFGEAVVGTMIGNIAISLLKNGLLTGTGDEDEPKEMAIQYDNVPPKSLNISAFRRGMSGQGFATKNNDVWIDYTKTGIMGNVFAMYANMGVDKTQEALQQIQLTEFMLKGLPSVMKTSFDQSYLKGTSALMEAMNKGGSSTDKLIANMVAAIGSIPYPNTVATISKSSDTTIRSIRDEELGQTIQNAFKQKMFMYDDLPSKVTLWGEKVKNAPEGRNKYLYNLFDITKYKNVPTETFGFKIYDKWKKSQDADWLPSLPKQTMSYEGVNVTLTPLQYEKYLELVGKERKALVEMYVNSESWDTETDEEKMETLKSLYDQGREIGKALFLESTPNLTPTKKQ